MVFLIILLIATVNAESITNLTGTTFCKEPVMKPEFVDIGTFDGVKNLTLARMRRSPRPMRLKIFYDHSVDNHPNSEYIKNEVVGPVENLINKVLKVVHPVQGSLKLPASCASRLRGTFKYQGKDINMPCYKSCGNAQGGTCWGFKIPKELSSNSCYYWNNGRIYKGGNENEGVPNTDVAIIVGAIRKGCDPGVGAFAASCKVDQATGRPILGFFNICIMKDRSNTAKNRAVALHEILHALGFSGNHFKNYRDENGQLRGTNNVIAKIKRPFHYKQNGRIVKGETPVSALITPRALKTAREFFGCPNMKYVDLEDVGQGSAGGHFEERTFGNDLMSPIIEAIGYLSPMVLAVLEDSGWYEANYNYATTPTYGRNAGCSFVQTGCLSYAMNKENPYPYSFKKRPSANKYTCSPNFEYAETNAINRYNGLQAKDRYFADPSEGGNQYANFCPIIVDSRKGDNRGNQWSTYCKDASNNEQIQRSENPFNEKFGPKSACFEHASWDISPRSRYVLQGGASCHQYRCENRKVIISFDAGNGRSTDFSCSREGETFSVNHKTMRQGRELQIQAQLKCPSPSVVCGN